MKIGKSAIQRFYNATKIYFNTLNALYDNDRKHPRRLLRRREFNKAEKWWGNERLLFAQNTEPRFEFDFADLFCTLHRFGVNDMETVYGVLSRIGFELVD